MKRCALIALLIACSFVAAMLATPIDDDRDYDESIRMPVRRLHPERERAKARAKLQKQMTQKADPNKDPWDTKDDPWGTVDLLPQQSLDTADVAAGEQFANKMKNTVMGRRLAGDNTSKTAADKAELERLLSKDYSIHEVEAIGARRMTWQDDPIDATREELMPHFVVIDGEYLPVGIDKDSKRANAVYFYFDISDGVLQPLHLRVQYYADDPLNYDQLIFTIDGHDYTFFPENLQRGKLSDEMYWENSDDPLHTQDKDLVYALAHSHWVLFKLQGTDGIKHVFLLDDEQRSAFARTLALYRLIGGTFN